jgi:general secretion pathway protein E
MSEGMQTLRLNGAHKVIAGDTTIAEVMRVAPPLQMS